MGSFSAHFQEEKRQVKKAKGARQEKRAHALPAAAAGFFFL
jgi:hypothetical protein